MSDEAGYREPVVPERKKERECLSPFQVKRRRVSKLETDETGLVFCTQLIFAYCIYSMIKQTI